MKNIFFCSKDRGQQGPAGASRGQQPKIKIFIFFCSKHRGQQGPAKKSINFIFSSSHKFRLWNRHMDVIRVIRVIQVIRVIRVHSSTRSYRWFIYCRPLKTFFILHINSEGQLLDGVNGSTLGEVNT